MPRFVKAALAAAFAALATAALAAPAPDPAAAQPGDMGLGNPKAKVKVVEYASVMCPHCARFNNEVFPAFKAKYVDTGKVYYVFRELPTQPTEVAVAGFLVARCAPADKYFPVIDALFKGQAELFEKQDAKQYLLDAAKVAGMNEDQVQACFKDKAKMDAFNDRVKAAIEDAKVEGTPTFLVGTKRLTGEQTLAQLDAAIEPQLSAR